MGHHVGSRGSCSNNHYAVLIKTGSGPHRWPQVCDISYCKQQQKYGGGQLVLNSMLPANQWNILRVRVPAFTVGKRSWGGVMWGGLRWTLRGCVVSLYFNQRVVMYYIKLLFFCSQSGFNSSNKLNQFCPAIFTPGTWGRVLALSTR